jgi:hypothetical protein
MVIVMGSALYMLFMIFTRTKLTPWRYPSREKDPHANRMAIIVAGIEESGRIKELINRSKDHIQIIGTVSPVSNDASLPPGTLGYIHQLEDIVRVYEVKEIIFSAQDVPFSVFTGSMTQLGPSLRYMLAASTTMNIVGSMSKDTEGESYAIRIHFNLSHPTSRRAKRIFDVLCALIGILTFPILVFLIPHAFSFFKNMIRILGGRLTWISYHPIDPVVASLPPLKAGVLHPAYPEDESDVTQRLQHIHYVYARDYHWTTDLSIVIAQLKKAGQTITRYDQ